MSFDRDSRSRSPVGGDNVHDEDSRGNFKREQGGRRNQRNTSSSGRSVRLCVGNLPYDYKWQELKDTFRKEVGAVSYVEVFDDENGRPRGVGVVEVDGDEMAQVAIEKMQRYEVRGRQMVVKDEDEARNMREFKFMFDKDFKLNRGGNRGRGNDRGRSGGNRFNDNNRNNTGGGIIGNTYGLSIPFLESLGVSGQISRSVFVSNLSYKVTSDDLREAFGVAGRVLNSKVMFNDEGKSRGFGLIEFEHPVQAVQAISMLHNQMYFDRRITVRMDRDPEKSTTDSSTSAAGGLPKGLSGLGMGLGNNGQPITDVNDIPVNTGGGGFNNQNQMPNNTVGMDPLALVNSLINTNPNFASNLMANMASMMGMQGGGGGGGGNVNTNPGPFGNANPNMGGGMGGGGMGGGGMGGGANMGGVGGMNNDFPNNFQNGGNSNNSNMGGAMGNNSFNSPRLQGNDKGSGRCSLKLSNLPFDYSWQSLKDLCRSYGEIAFVENPKNGVGVIRFTNEANARKAADMLDRQRFDGRVLDAIVI